MSNPQFVERLYLESEKEEYAFQHAQDMSDWFADYLYGVQEEPGILPLLTVERLFRQFGVGDIKQHIETIRNSLMVFEEVHQANLALYFCGYPDQALDMLTDEEVTLRDSLAVLDAQFPPQQIPAHDTLLEDESLVERRFRIRKTREKVVGVVAVQSNTTATQHYEPANIPQGSIIRATQLPIGMIQVDSQYLPWMNDALCAQTDPELFFPQKGGSTRGAKKVCGECDVREQCLGYALASDERFGIWGGKSERERRKLKKTEPKPSR